MILDQPITIVIPEKGRSGDGGKLDKTLIQMDQVTHYPRDLLKLVIALDGDPDGAEWVEANKDRFHLNIEVLSFKAHAYYIRNMNRAIKRGVTTDLFVYINNDVLVHPRWLVHLVTHFMKKFPNKIGLVSMNDGWSKGDVAAHGMSSKQFIDYRGYDGGNFFYPGYMAYFGDTEISWWAKRRPEGSVYSWAEHCRIDHKTLRTNDKVLAMHDPFHLRDHVIFRERDLQGFPVKEDK